MASKVYCPHCGRGFVPKPRKRRVQEATTTAEVETPKEEPRASGTSPTDSIKRKFAKVRGLI